MKVQTQMNYYVHCNTTLLFLNEPGDYRLSLLLCFWSQMVWVCLCNIKLTWEVSRAASRVSDPGLNPSDKSVLKCERPAQWSSDKDCSCKWLPDVNVYNWEWSRAFLEKSIHAQWTIYKKKIKKITTEMFLSVASWQGSSHATTALKNNQRQKYCRKFSYF